MKPSLNPFSSLPPGVTFRTATSADDAFRFALFAGWQAEEWTSVGGLPLPAALVRLQFEARERSRRERFLYTRPLLLLREGEPVGEVLTAFEPDCLRLADILLLPAHRGVGIGGALMLSLQAEAARRGVPVRLSVAAGNLSARRFYERRGFVVVRQTAGWQDVEMVWYPPDAAPAAVAASPRYHRPTVSVPALLAWVGVLLLLLVSRPAFAQFVESEPNNDKTNADAFTLSAGSTVRGNTQDAAVAGQGDYFHLTFNNPTVGFYRSTLTITSTVSQSSFTGSIRGLTQSNGVVTAGSDTIVQNVIQNSSGTNSNLFYTAGTGSSIYYRVTGSAATTADYTVTYQRQLITPTSIGSFAAGPITFTSVGYAFTPTGGQADTSLAVFDSTFNLIGEDTPNVYLNDNSASGTPGSTLIRNFSTPGTYYLAVTNGHLSSSSSAASDDSGATGLSSPVLDFSRTLSNNNTFTDRDISFRAYNGNTYLAPAQNANYTNYLVDAVRTNAYEVNFYSFTVVLPEPNAGSLLATGTVIGGLATMRTKRQKANS